MRGVKPACPGSKYSEGACVILMSCAMSASIACVQYAMDMRMNVLLEGLNGIDIEVGRPGII